MEEILEKQLQILDLFKKILADIQSDIISGILEDKQIKNGILLIETFDKINKGRWEINCNSEFIIGKLIKVINYYNAHNYEAANDITESLFIIIDIMCDNLGQKDELYRVNSQNKYIYFNQLINKYKDSTDKDIVEVLNYIIKHQVINTFNYDFVNQYMNELVNCYYDEDNKMSYVMYNNKKMYFKQSMSAEEIQQYFCCISAEQDDHSPHKYFTNNILVNDGDIVIDAGVAEGNFALDVIDKVQKLYIIECDEEWLKALRLTFKDYADKVVIVDKMLGNIVDDTHITIDELCHGEMINFIKMDIEGSEIDALAGARETLMNSTDCKCTICTYHRKDDEIRVSQKLKEYGFDTHPSKGYMYFFEDIDTYIESDFRRGLVRGIK